MNAVQAAGAASFLGRFEGLRERLPGDREIRDRAAAAFRAGGFPTVRDEAWKYTSLRPVTEASFYEPLLSVADGGDLLAELPVLDGPRLVFLDGRFRPQLSVLPENIEVGTFAETAVFGRLARPDRDPLVALNTMLTEDGAVIGVPDGVDAGLLQLVSIATDVPGRAVAFHPRHCIRLGRGARLMLLEMSGGGGTYLHNPVTEAYVADGAVLVHVRLQDESRTAYHLSTLYAEVARGGTYDSFNLNLGARVARTEVHARLKGERSATHLNGAQMLGGTQHGDFTTIVSHDAPSCASRQTVKNVLSGRARGVFQGKIEVARAAQKTDGYQMNQALLLSPEAEIDSKPQLEIYADDVKCSHGATVGELDAEQLFYLRSRGIPEAEARSILVRAFLTEALDAIGDDTVRASLDRAVDAWWGKQAA
ncbi:MAG: Fe-S cluster assembly protein SufD [Acetobacteraceae bacterium]|nr:Fe-S cluster assembly protein SufD [Acetobacteraceae bacterium]